MASLGQVATGFVGALHGYILVLEMFLWTTPRGRKAFKLTPEFAQQTRTLAANQGLYNGFLSAGLLWGIMHPDPNFGAQIKLFFLGCVGVAGAYGGWTVGPRLMLIQTVPAAISAGLVLLGL
ncbi:hypothetical protein QQX98_000279 [Neonectria punicea]|uniref:Integral membrane protein n=1 Tax=Neonectria punicea TaxID=979145 RepID=A0ABR1HUI3_9HYPO